MKSLLLAIAFAAALSAFTHIQPIKLGEVASFGQESDEKTGKVVR